MKKFIAVLILMFQINLAWAGDLKELTQIFKDNYDAMYVQRMCGENILRLVKEARRQGLNLDNAYVLRVAGSGFLETSGFYTRTAPNNRAMLGYFHFVLVVDDHVFDFDLNEPLVLPIHEYVKLQFFPPYEPFVIYGITYNAMMEMKYWDARIFSLDSYVSAQPLPYKKTKLSEIIDLKKLEATPRIR